MKKSGNIKVSNSDSEQETPKPKQGKKVVDPKKSQEFVIKLFDRTINLSELNGKTPLYKICHDWISNNNVMITTRLQLQQQQQNKPSQQEQKEYRDFDVWEKLKSEEISEIHAMPPIDKSVKMKEKMEIDDEEKDERRKNLDSILLFEEDLEEYSKENLLAEHKNNWKKKKGDWIKEREEFNQKKYAESVEMIDYLYKPF